MVTAVLVSVTLAAVAHLYAASRPEARTAALMRELALGVATLLGILTLAATPLVYRVRRVPPPSGVTAFAVCVAVAPIVAVLLRMLD